ncbi:uncharacterized protein LOC128553894 [Mercenaria mercenaria]|uniref:uncharacterized protein LOC128553894 n=1 Tax=Mercenaria mercenaria TaxID=6596 RepID=UPI00234EE79B|nr:uncharacterized protein LOC128553894 [Mercenaria mercenaria]
MYQHILMPLCVNNHWVLLVAEVQKRTVGVLDSLNRDNTAIINKFCEFMMHRGAVTDADLADGWVKVNLKSSAQKDGCSCGVFVLNVPFQNAECVVNEKDPLRMRQVHPDNFREYVRNRLIGEGVPCGTTKCDGLFSRKTRGPSNWIQCDICHRWWHKVCGNVDRKLVIEEYFCVICEAQYY